MKNIAKRIPFFWNVICGLSSIISLWLVVTGNKDAIIIALLFFCISVTLLLAVIVWAIYSYVKVGKKSDYVRISTDIKYETLDGYHILYETYRVVQSKCILLSNIDHGFKWSGTKTAKISSDLQKIERINHVGAKDEEYDTASMKIDPPLSYNETGVIHFKAEMDDSDEKSDTMICYKTTSYSEMIRFRVILKHKDENFKKNAKVYKKKISNNTLAKEKEIDQIPFDVKTKSYEYIKTRPEIGYFYILRWER